MNGEPRRPGLRAKSARLASAAFRSRLTAVIVALSLIAQLFAVPYHRALAAPESARLDNAAIAAGLKATFGDAVVLCVQADGKGAPLAPASHCDDQCTLCRFAAQISAFAPPDALSLPARLQTERQTIAAAPDSGAVRACPTKRTRARAPPLAV